MAGTRRSTRQSTAATPKYAEPDSSVSEDEAPKRKAKQPTRRKRAREDTHEDEVHEDEYVPQPRLISIYKSCS